MRLLLMRELLLSKHHAPMSISWKRFKGMELFNSVRAASLDPTGEAVEVRGDNLPWESGENPALGQRHNDMSQTLHEHRLRQRGSDTQPRCLHQMWRVQC